MFEEILGIPAHPLLVHAAVVFVPLLILVGLGYALVPAAAPVPVVGSPSCSPSGRRAPRSSRSSSGDAFRARLVRNDMATPEGLVAIDEHRTFGTNLVYASLALGVLVMVLVLMTRPSRDPGEPATSFSAATIALTVAVLAAGGAAGYYVFKAGDTGRPHVWGGYVAAPTVRRPPGRTGRRRARAGSRRRRSPIARVSAAAWASARSIASWSWTGRLRGVDGTTTLSGRQPAGGACIGGGPW